MTKPIKQQKAPGVDLDSRDIIGNLTLMWDDSTTPGGFDKDLYMQKLCSFIVRRDHQVFNYAFTLGKNKVAHEGKDNYSQSH
jgi:uncharacterized protein YydD (DUF2326 family)